MGTDKALWRIEELAAQVSTALIDDYAGQDSGRVRDIPDVRAIRYYTTLGILDRPADFRGRVALYGRRHLLQLVAIKRLQARGISLAEIQQRLPGLSDAKLAAIAKVSMGDRAAGARSAPLQERVPEGERGPERQGERDGRIEKRAYRRRETSPPVMDSADDRALAELADNPELADADLSTAEGGCATTSAKEFVSGEWRPPVALSTAEGGSATTAAREFVSGEWRAPLDHTTNTPAAPHAAAQERDQSAGPLGRRVQNASALAAVTLTPGVTLLFEPHHFPDDFDLEALRTASAPLLKVLQQRRLLRRAERNSPE